MNDHQTPIDELDTDVLLELLLQGYEVANLEQLPKLHRLARKIEAVLPRLKLIPGRGCTHGQLHCSALPLPS